MSSLQSHTITKPSWPKQPLIVLLTHSAADLSNEQLVVLIEQARQRRWRLLDVGLAGDSLSGERKPTGAVVTELPSHPLVLQMREMGCPVVRIGRLEHPDDTMVPAVLPSLIKAGRLAAEHWIERGFKHLALFGHESMAVLPLIASGYRDRLDAQDRRYHRLLLANPDDSHAQPPDYGKRMRQRDALISHWLKSLPKPVGIVACNPYYVGMLSLLCQRAGLSIPEDVALLSIGDQCRICEMASVPISAVDTGPERMMAVAIERLDQMIKGESVPAQTFIAPMRVITRRSTDILAVDHPVVARTIRFMWDRLEHVDLSVDDIAKAMGTPRSTLERYFREHFERGIYAELRRARLHHFAQLLRTTDLPVRELSPRVGFKSPMLLHTAFCQAYGMTPRTYRLQASRTAESD